MLPLFVEEERQLTYHALSQWGLDFVLTNPQRDSLRLNTDEGEVL